MLAAVIAFLPSLGYQEMFLLLVVGLLLYGRNLPEAGKNLGRVAAQLRRGWHEFKQQMDRDGDLREVKKTLQGTADELRRVADVPRAVADPRRAIGQFAQDAMTAPPPEETTVPVRQPSAGSDTGSDSATAPPSPAKE